MFFAAEPMCSFLESIVPSSSVPSLFADAEHHPELALNLTLAAKY